MKDDTAPVKVGAVDIEAFAKNLARMVEEGGKALAAYMKPREEGQVQAGLSDEMNDMVKTLGEVLGKRFDVDGADLHRRSVVFHGHPAAPSSQGWAVLALDILASYPSSRSIY